MMTLKVLLFNRRCKDMDTPYYAGYVCQIHFFLFKRSGFLDKKNNATYTTHIFKIKKCFQSAQMKTKSNCLKKELKINNSIFLVGFYSTGSNEISLPCCHVLFNNV